MHPDVRVVCTDTSEFSIVLVPLEECTVAFTTDMPRKRKSPDDNRKPKRTYWCDCNERCGGVDHEVSKSTYHEHAPFRKKPMLEVFKRLLGNAIGAGKAAAGSKSSGATG